MARLLDPAQWHCDTCHSTDGVWVCLECGHAGCSRLATMGPALGGGHALHHHCIGGGRKCPCVFDVVSHHLHCYECDDYVVNDPKWLDALRSKLEGLVPAPPPPLVHEDVGDRRNPVPGHTGLANLGNTCFMNSAVQMLANLSGFRAFFMDFLREAGDVSVGSVGLARQTTSAWLPKLEPKAKPAKFELTPAMHGLLRVVRAGRCRVLQPHLLVQSVWIHAGSLFTPYVQCCAAEFLTYVLDRLTLELGEKAGRVVRDLFAVEVEYATRCTKCKRVSTRRERNHDLHVTLPEDEAAPAGSVLELLKAQLGRAEPISEYRCEGCRGSLRSCTRVASLVSHPPILLLTLKRTRYNPKTRRVYKDYRPVPFPPTLPLSALPVVAASGASATAAASSAHDASSSTASSPHYRLAAVIVHSSAPDRRTGRHSADAGHYYTYCREEPRNPLSTGVWLEKNDAKVRDATEAEVLSNERGCFVLAYELVGAAGGMTPAPSPRLKPAASPRISDAGSSPGSFLLGGAPSRAACRSSTAEPPVLSLRRPSRRPREDDHDDAGGAPPPGSSTDTPPEGASAQPRSTRSRSS